MGRAFRLVKELNGDGAPVHPDRLSLHFARLALRLGMPDVRLHDLHHAWVSDLLAKGVPPPDVSRAASHATSSFTMDRYGHLMPNHTDRMRQALNATGS